eukprot:PLAT3313.29.p3 GENE.PLAT3313.29~~PLAT3313.29.p3  ORF type:complete len:489 (-),score=-42.09 PLAT3313.29:299-1765(-)
MLKVEKGSVWKAKTNNLSSIPNRERNVGRSDCVLASLLLLQICAWRCPQALQLRGVQLDILARLHGCRRPPAGFSEQREAAPWVSAELRRAAPSEAVGAELAAPLKRGGGAGESLRELGVRERSPSPAQDGPARNVLAQASPSAHRAKEAVGALVEACDGARVGSLGDADGELDVQDSPCRAEDGRVLACRASERGGRREEELVGAEQAVEGEGGRTGHDSELSLIPVGDELSQHAAGDRRCPGRVVPGVASGAAEHASYALELDVGLEHVRVDEPDAEDVRLHAGGEQVELPSQEPACPPGELVVRDEPASVRRCEATESAPTTEPSPGGGVGGPCCVGVGEGLELRGPALEDIVGRREAVLPVCEPRNERGTGNSRAEDNSCGRENSSRRDRASATLFSTPGTWMADMEAPRRSSDMVMAAPASRIAGECERALLIMHTVEELSEPTRMCAPFKRDDSSSSAQAAHRAYVTASDSLVPIENSLGKR